MYLLQYLSKNVPLLQVIKRNIPTRFDFKPIKTPKMGRWNLTTKNHRRK